MKYKIDESGHCIIPEGTGIIKDDAFWYCLGLKSVELSDSVTSIGWQAFSCCSGLKSIKIPDSVTLIVNSAFYGCSNLKSLTVHEKKPGKDI